MKEIKERLAEKQEQLRKAIIEYDECEATDTKEVKHLWEKCKRLESYINALEFSLDCIEREMK